MPRRRSERGGFTLIEVLVVVAIIALLIAILMPSLAAARAAARQAQCLSNIHQFNLAIGSYSSQNNGYIPRGGDPNTLHWTILVARMLGDKTSYIFHNGTAEVYSPNMLPVDKRPVYQCPERESTQAAPFVDYVCNDLDPNGPNAGGWMSNKEAYMKVEVYKRPADVVFIADAERKDKNIRMPYCTWLTDAYTNWQQIHNNPALGDTISGIDAMDVWVGEHVPEGYRSNTTDQAGPRRVARKMHLQRFTDCGFFDGHGTGVSLCPSFMTPQSKYRVWLRRFGVKDSLLYPQDPNDTAVNAPPGAG